MLKEDYPEKISFLLCWALSCSALAEERGCKVIMGWQVISGTKGCRDTSSIFVPVLTLTLALILIYQNSRHD